MLMFLGEWNLHDCMASYTVLKLLSQDYYGTVRQFLLYHCMSDHEPGQAHTVLYSFYINMLTIFSKVCIDRDNSQSRDQSHFFFFFFTFSKEVKMWLVTRQGNSLAVFAMKLTSHVTVCWIL